MPTPQTPLVLVDNVFDRINLYPSATLASSGATPGREVQYVADYRRERTYFQAATSAAARWIQSDIGSGNTAAPDTLWIDRGHNLWGKSIIVISRNTSYADAEDVSQSSPIMPVPAQGTVGGDPSLGFCVTEEGALYTFFAPLLANRFHVIVVYETWQPIITGVILGKRVQFSMFSSVMDEDSAERSERSEKSLIPGYVGRDRVYAARRVSLDLSYIGAAEYDATIRPLRRLLFERDQPAFIVVNYGANPERGWLYQYQGTSWSAPKKAAYRNHSMSLTEIGPLVR